MVVTICGCQWRHNSQTGSTCWDSGVIPLDAHLIDWLTVLGLRDKVKEQNGAHIFMVVTSCG